MNEFEIAVIYYFDTYSLDFLPLRSRSILISCL